MKAHVTFVRDDSCAHSAERECTLCFKDGIADFMGSQDGMEEAWRNRFTSDEPEDFVDELTVSYGVETLTIQARDVITVMPTVLDASPGGCAPCDPLPVTDSKEAEKQKNTGGAHAEVVATFPNPRDPDAPLPENPSSGGPYR